MTKKYSKKKQKTISDPNPAGPGYRTPSSFRGNQSYAGNKNQSQVKFNPAGNRMQHK